MDHASGAVAPPDAEVVQVGDAMIINHVRLNQPIRHCESGLPPTLSLVLELNEEEPDALVHKATIDACRRWAGHA
jgi:hypothetical protein